MRRAEHADEIWQVSHSYTEKFVDMELFQAFILGKSSTLRTIMDTGSPAESITPTNDQSGAPPGSPKVVKIFLATPSDLSDERLELAALIKDINDVLTFLAPEKRLSLELLATRRMHFRTLASRKTSSIARSHPTMMS
jgi:hypothetical protein